jgi:hypothetical protein
MRHAALLLLPTIACAEIPADKIGHFAAGATAAAIVPILIDHPKAPEFWLAAGVALGIAKEVYDSQYPGRHKVEAADIAATALGAALVYGGIKATLYRSDGATILIISRGM